MSFQNNESDCSFGKINKPFYSLIMIMIRTGTLNHLEICVIQLLNEAKSRDWTVEKTKHKLVEMFVTNNEKFRVEVYNERWLDKVAGIDKHDIDRRLNCDEGDE